MIYLSITIIILLQAVSDGLREMKQKRWAKTLEHASIIALFFIPMLYKVHELAMYFNIFLLYVFIRAYLFDPVMHFVSGWHPNFVGTTSPWWDKLMARMNSWQFWVFRAFFLALSIFWYIVAIKNY